MTNNKKDLIVLKKIRDLFSSTVEISFSHKQINPPSINMNIDNLSIYYCGVCGKQNIECVSSGIEGSVAGGYRWYEFLCKDCNKYTEYEHEWG